MKALLTKPFSVTLYTTRDQGFQNISLWGKGTLHTQTRHTNQLSGREWYRTWPRITRHQTKETDRQLLPDCLLRAASSRAPPTRNYLNLTTSTTEEPLPPQRGQVNLNFWVAQELRLILKNFTTLDNACPPRHEGTRNLPWAGFAQLKSSTWAADQYLRPQSYSMWTSCVCANWCIHL